MAPTKQDYTKLYEELLKQQIVLTVLVTKVTVNQQPHQPAKMINYDTLLTQNIPTHASITSIRRWET